MSETPDPEVVSGEVVLSDKDETPFTVPNKDRKGERIGFRMMKVTQKSLHISDSKIAFAVVANDGEKDSIMWESESVARDECLRAIDLKKAIEYLRDNKTHEVAIYLRVVE